jgi:hypothetical protein
LSLFSSLPFGCLLSNGTLISKLLTSFITEGVGYQLVTREIRDQLLEEYLSEIEDQSYELFASSMDSSPDLHRLTGPASLSLVQSFKQKALLHHSKFITLWNESSIDSKKRLRSKISVVIETHRTGIRQQVRESCRNLIEELDQRSISSTAASTSSNSSTANVVLNLGESANSYNEFLALKNSIEKLVTSYSTATQQYVTASPQQTSVTGGRSDRILLEEVDSIRSEILRIYLLQRLKRSLEMGGDWLAAFRDLINSTSAKKETLKSKLLSLQVSHSL